MPLGREGERQLTSARLGPLGAHIYWNRQRCSDQYEWGDETAVEVVKTKTTERADIVPEQESEVWLVNSMVHNNYWADASVNDLRPVLESTRAFINLFTCDNPDCGGWVYTGWPEDAFRCDCDNYNYNLNLKKK